MSSRVVRRMVTSLSAVALGGAPVVVNVPSAGAEGTPSMCAGRTDPSLTLTAHSTGASKFILNLATDAAGVPTGVLIVGRQGDRIEVTSFCRLWQHVPGQEPDGAGEDIDESATTAHAVGIGELRDGTRVLVRTDVRENDEGAFFRLRYRVMGAHGGEEGSPGTGGGSGHDEGDDSWVRMPSEGWAPLDQFRLR